MIGAGPQQLPPQERACKTYVWKTLKYGSQPMGIKTREREGGLQFGFFKIIVLFLSLSKYDGSITETGKNGAVKLLVHFDIPAVLQEKYKY